MEKITQGRLIAATTAESADLVYGSGFFAPDELKIVKADPAALFSGRAQAQNVWFARV